jgi:hypothetical protein
MRSMVGQEYKKRFGSTWSSVNQRLSVADSCPSELPIMREQERVDLLQKLGRPLFPVGTPFSKAVFGSIVPERGKYMRGVS